MLAIVVKSIHTRIYKCICFTLSRSGTIMLTNIIPIALQHLVYELAKGRLLWACNLNVSVFLENGFEWMDFNDFRNSVSPRNPIMNGFSGESSESFRNCFRQCFQMGTVTCHLQVKYLPQAISPINIYICTDLAHKQGLKPSSSYMLWMKFFSVLCFTTYTYCVLNNNCCVD